MQRGRCRNGPGEKAGAWKWQDFHLGPWEAWSRAIRERRC